jgi:alpha-tubulin suppressor-like RCC1 family protein
LNVVGGYSALFALKTDGTLWAWGAGANGQLGQSNTTDYSSPKQIGALTTWSILGSNARNAGAIKTDGTLWMWGAGSTGQLGLGNITAYSSPKQVGALTTWAKIAGGSDHTLATKTP